MSMKIKMEKKRKNIMLPLHITDYIETNSKLRGYTENVFIQMIIEDFMRRENFDYDND